MIDFENSKELPESEHYIYNEYTWNFNAAFSIAKGLLAGGQIMTIFASGTRIENEFFHIYGAFVQYDFFAYTKSKASLFIETSFNTGDYLTAGWEDPYRREGLYYYGFGGGLELPLSKVSKRLFLDLSFYNYHILNKIHDKYNYTQYIVGLNYHIGKPRKYK
jgi:hypothetical protein